MPITRVIAADIALVVIMGDCLVDSASPMGRVEITAALRELDARVTSIGNSRGYAR